VRSVGALRREEDHGPHLGEVLEFMRIIWQVDHTLQRRSKKMEAALGVTGPQRLVLRIVGRFPGIPAGHLARLLHVHPSTLTGVVQRLERQRLLRRRADPRDARRALLSLTEQGRALDVRTPDTVESAVERVLARVPRARVEAAREVLLAIAASLEDLPDQQTAGAAEDADGR
jgi:DNA-binding MarR family transcriptional regulator